MFIDEDEKRITKQLKLMKQPDEYKLKEQKYIEIDKKLMREKFENLYEAKDIYLIYNKIGKKEAMTTGVINKIEKVNKPFTLFRNCERIMTLLEIQLFY